jgi:hypothetical protein
MCFVRVSNSESGMPELRKYLLAAVLAVVLPAQAQAQALSDQTIGDFVDSHSAITRLDKIARWEEGVCPSLAGLPASFSKFIIKRVRDVAASVGAPVDADDACKSNIDIVFTTNPQGMLDTVRHSRPVMLGYFDSSAQADRMAVVNHTIQAWHATQSVDLHGQKVIDIRNPTSITTSGINMMSSTGTRLGDGLRSTYNHAIIVADPTKLGDAEIGTLADTIAMLALAQPAQEDACTALPSILDMTNPACHKDKPATTLTAADMGYLRGLYQEVNPGATLRTQKDGIAFHIKQALAEH